MRRIFFAFLVIIIFLEISANNHTAKPKREFMQKFEMIKYHLDLNDFEKAEILADSLFADSIYTDSLHYFKGLAFGGENNWKVAADEFSKVILLTKTESLRQKAEDKLQKSLLELHPTDAIEKVTAILDSLNNEEIHNDLFLIMARIYEKNQLFEEAIDIYRNLLNESNFADTFYLHLKIAENDIFRPFWSHYGNFCKRTFQPETDFAAEKFRSSRRCPFLFLSDELFAAKFGKSNFRFVTTLHRISRE